MSRVVIFGGTSEGRALCELCAQRKLPLLCCVATEDGARALTALPDVEVRVGRLEAAQMAPLLSRAALVIDATHPYAEAVSRNIAAACRSAGAALLRVAREEERKDGVLYFSSMDSLLSWLEETPGGIFVALGSSYAAALCKLSNYQDRLWLRMLPSIESLRSCLELGYPPKRLICMQGPFSETLNRALFEESKASILLTKESGRAGGFSEKVQAAKALGMHIAVLSRPEERGGVSLQEAAKRLGELNI